MGFKIKHWMTIISCMEQNLNKTLRKLAKKRLRDQMKEDGVLNRFKNKIYKSKKDYNRKIKHKGNEFGTNFV